jgi:hypothetical protein
VISCVGLGKFKESALLVVIEVRAPHRAPLHDQKISGYVVCISPERRIIDLTFFHPIIDLGRYTNDILFALSAQSDEGEIDYFHQDGTSAHRVRNSMKLLQKVLETVKGGLAPRPPCLASPRFFSGEP